VRHEPVADAEDRGPDSAALHVAVMLAALVVAASHAAAVVTTDGLFHRARLPFAPFRLFLHLGFQSRETIPDVHRIEAVTAPDKPLEQLRAICESFPEVTERISHGEPTWFIRDKKTFVTFADHHHDDRLAFWCAAPEGAQDFFVSSFPDRYFKPPYVGVRGWLGVYLDVPVDWDEVASIVEDAYRAVAPPKLLRQLDATPTH
jgi:hypothetical protein